MAWVRRITECRTEVVVSNPETEGLRQGPVLREQRRVCVELPVEAFARTVSPRAHALPTTKGAGPCGTLARRPSGRSYATWWSVRHLVRPMAAYYASYVAPLRFGAKPGPRGRRAE